MLPHQGFSTTQLAFHGLHRDAAHPGTLAVGELVEITQHKHYTGFRRHVCQRGLQGTAALTLDIGALRSLRGWQSIQTLWDGLTPLLTAILINADVGDNTVQPSTQTPLRIVRLALLPGLQEGLLRGILGILRMAQHFESNAI